MTPISTKKVETRYGDVVNNTIVWQYYLNCSICGDVEPLPFKDEPHGNAKSDSSFDAVKKSTIIEIGEKFAEKNSKVSVVYNEMKVVQGTYLLDFGDTSRSKHQEIKKAGSLEVLGKIGIFMAPRHYGT
eukprot:Seg222.14 transcript_id=Seg222.14/GoldUCD/mRNA.D3Y31 product="hypothetical protein" protein_id=Seg222.14/GoldUCD/D3Y31